MRQVFVAVRATLYATGFLALWGWLAIRLREFDLERGLALPVRAGSLGIAAIFLGAALMLSCVVVFFVVGRGTPAPFDPPREFVASGPYRFVRNPMFLGLLARAVGVQPRGGVAIRPRPRGLRGAPRPPLRASRRGTLARAPFRGGLRRVPPDDEPLAAAPSAGGLTVQTGSGGRFFRRCPAYATT